MRPARAAQPRGLVSPIRSAPKCSVSSADGLLLAGLAGHAGSPRRRAARRPGRTPRTRASRPSVRSVPPRRRVDRRLDCERRSGRCSRPGRGCRYRSRPALLGRRRWPRRAAGRVAGLGVPIRSGRAGSGGVGSAGSRRAGAGRGRGRPAVDLVGAGPAPTASARGRTGCGLGRSRAGPGRVPARRVCSPPSSARTRQVPPSTSPMRLDEQLGLGAEHVGVHRVLEHQHDLVAVHVADHRLADDRPGSRAAPADHGEHLVPDPAHRGRVERPDRRGLATGRGRALRPARRRPAPGSPDGGGAAGSVGAGGGRGWLRRRRRRATVAAGRRAWPGRSPGPGQAPPGPAVGRRPGVDGRAEAALHPLEPLQQRRRASRRRRAAASGRRSARAAAGARWCRASRSVHCGRCRPGGTAWPGPSGRPARSSARAGPPARR